MTETHREHFFSLLHNFKNGILTTHAQNGELHGRPMSIARIENDGDIWLVTDIHSEKVEELTTDARVGIAMQDGQRYLTVNGKGEVVRNRELIYALWNEAWRVWFTNGVNDPNLVLLKIRVVHGEYWDNEGTNGVRFIYRAAKAYFTGQRPSLNETTLQGKVELTH